VSEPLRDLQPAPSAPAAPLARAEAPPISGAQAAAAGEKHGWVRVGGDTLVGARVEADGTFAGFAPLELSLPLGSHVIVVTSVAGHVLVRRHVHLGEAQTRLTPLRILR